MTPRTTEQNKVIRKQTRQQIQEAAFKLFAEKGFANTTISSIAQKADVSKGLIYHYFKSKEDILEHIFHYWIKMTQYMLHFPDDMPPKEKMETMLISAFEFIEKRPEISRFMTALALQPEAIAALKPYLDKVRIQQINIIAGLLENLNYDNPEAEAYYLGAKLDGIALGYITLGEEYPWNQMIQKILDEYVRKENH